MFVIRGKIKNNNTRNWFVTGYDSRPLKFQTYGTALRECQHYNDSNTKNVLEYGDEEVIYEVVEYNYNS